MKGVASTGGFRPRAGFFVPPASDSNPFFLTLAGGKLGVELEVIRKAGVVLGRDADAVPGGR